MGEWDAKTAEWYAEHYGDYATNRLGVAGLEIVPDAVIADVGCGTGAALRTLLDLAPGATLIGVDPVPRMLEIARERAAEEAGGERIDFREGSAEALPLEDSTVDILLAFDSIDHWTDRVRGLAEVRRVLRASGRLIVVKDGGIPGGARERIALRTALEEARLTVHQEVSVEADGVSFTRWICSLG